MITLKDLQKKVEKGISEYLEFDIKEIVKLEKNKRGIPDLPKIMSIDEMDIYLKLVTGTKQRELIKQIMEKEHISQEGAIQRIRRTRDKMNAFQSFMNKLGILPKDE